MKRDGLYARFFCAFSFLTRLRLPGGDRIDFTPAVLTGSVVFYPLVGLFYALVVGLLWLLCRGLGLDPALGAFAVLAAPYLINRFLHFDGLCDVLDGFLADRSPEQRLAIMKDSRNGSFAMGGAALFLLAKYLLIRSLWDADALAVLLLAPVLMRWLVILMAFRAVYPRPTGTAFNLVGKVSSRLLAGSGAMLLGCLTVAGLGLAALPAVPTGEGAAIRLALSLGTGVLVALAWTIWLRGVSRRKIGGVTGDVLGCLVETGEAAVYLGTALALAVLRLAGL